MSIQAFSHFGLCVSNLENSQRFYCEGLGFQATVSFEIGNEASPLVEVEGDISLQSQFIHRDGVNIELLNFKSSQTHGEPSKSRAQLGLTHLGLYVDDLEAVAKKLIELGGSAVEGAETVMPQADGGTLKLAFFADPDGTRIELMQKVPASQ